jgi:uncharacterized membrane protein YdjX (TVP38/TMEM64 family)
MANRYLINSFKIFILLAIVFGMYVGGPLIQPMMAKLLTLNKFEAFLSVSFIFILGNLILLPVGLPINFLAGIIWGTFGGGVIINALAAISATISFCISRFMGAAITSKYIKRYPRLAELKDTVNRYDWQFIAMMRLNPIIPFSLSNYAFGLIPELSFRHYIVATILANLIPSFIFAGIGNTLKSATLQNHNFHQVMLEVGVLLLLVSVMITYKMLASNSQNYLLSKKPS